jgi:hypothetical protein
MVFSLTLKNVKKSVKLIPKLTGVNYHVRWVPCHHSMARPQVVVGGDALQFCRVAANILGSRGHPTRGGPPV